MIDPNNNRIAAVVGSGNPLAANYDASGNLTGIGGTTTYTFDADNRITAAPSAQYFYDAEGRRVRSVVNGVTTWFLYDALGQLAQEFTSVAPTTAASTRYLTADHLGSTRAVTDATGTLAACSDYLPFGEDEPISTGDPRLALPCYAAEKPRQKFTGQPRDLETNLDFFGARYLSAPQGRFLSADNPFLDQDPADPQSWNLYAYVRNNPLNLVDPSGTDASDPTGTVCDANGNNCAQSINVNDAPGFLDTYIVDPIRRLAETANNLRDAANRFYATRDKSCLTAFTVTVAVGGAVIGGVQGAAAGTATGAALGTLALPGGGTLAGGVGGGAAGTATGTLLGGAIGGLAGHGLGLIFCSSSTGGGGGGQSPPQRLGGHKSSTKWANQMAKRGWTEQQIDEAIAGGKQFPAPNNVNPANGATRFVHPTTGRSVVIDNVTKELLHVGGDGFKY